VKTGFLKSSIGYAYNVSKLKLTLYCNASYAAFQEWGTPKTPAHPFMRPALSAISRFLRGSAVLQVAETPEANQSDVKNRANAGSGGTRVEVGHGDFE
jgi:HK97 gp10 family phage protein